MKKIIAFVVVLAGLSGHNLVAQVSVSKGVRVGLNNSTYTTSNSPVSYDAKSGFLIGGFLGLEILGPLDAEVEVLMTQKGAKYSLPGNGTTQSFQHNLTYLEVPVTAKLSLPLLPFLSWYLRAGPTFALKLGESFNVDGQDSGGTDEIAKSSDSGFVVGLGLKFSPLIAQFTIGVRYTAGLNSLLDTDDTVELKNRVFSLVAGVGF